MNHQPVIMDLIKTFYINNILLFLLKMGIGLIFSMIILGLIQFFNNKETNNLSNKIIELIKRIKYPSLLVFSFSIILILIGVISSTLKTDKLCKSLTYSVKQIIIREDFSESIPSQIEVEGKLVPIVLTKNTVFSLDEKEEPYVVMLERALWLKVKN